MLWLLRHHRVRKQKTRCPSPVLSQKGGIWIRNVDLKVDHPLVESKIYTGDAFPSYLARLRLPFSTERPRPLTPYLIKLRGRPFNECPSPKKSLSDVEVPLHFQGFGEWKALKSTHRNNTICSIIRKHKIGSPCHEVDVLEACTG